MQIIKTIFAIAAITALSGCLETDGERALAGAAGGALVADATGNSVATGAAVGALAGVLCDDAGVCN